MNNVSGVTSGATTINELGNASRGFYFNSIDINGIDRTSYFSSFTGQNVTITFTQNGNTAIYSGDTNSFKNWSQSGETGFVFGTGIGVPPSGTPSGSRLPSCRPAHRGSSTGTAQEYLSTLAIRGYPEVHQ